MPPSQPPRSRGNKSPRDERLGPLHKGPSSDSVDAGLSHVVGEFLALDPLAQREALYEWMRTAPAFACALVLNLGWRLDPSVRIWGERNGRIVGGLALQELDRHGLIRSSAAARR